MHTAVSHAIVLLSSAIFSPRGGLAVLKRKRSFILFLIPQRRIFLLMFRRKFLRPIMLLPFPLLSLFILAFSKVVHGALLRSEFNFRRDCAVSWRRIIFSQELPDHDSGVSASVSSTTSSGLQRTVDGSDLSAAACSASSSTTPAWHLCINKFLLFFHISPMFSNRRIIE